MSRHAADPFLVKALAAGKSVAAAAAEACVSKRTAFRRLQDPHFQKQVAERKTELVNHISSSLSNHTLAACALLTDLALKASSETVRISAARTIIDKTIRFRDIASFESRLNKLEAESRSNRADELQAVLDVLASTSS